MDFEDLSYKKRIERCHTATTPYRITDGREFRLKNISPGDTGNLDSEDKQESKSVLALGVSMLADLQARLYADDKWGVLCLFQATDAAGKDGSIKHVMSGVNPQGCQVASFKVPSSEELDHDYMWRYFQHMPERGRIGIFNRSYYEEVLVARVHQEVLGRQKLPKKLVTKSIWKQRYEDIRNFERYLARNGYVICKFFLHLSKKEQKNRFMARLDTPERNWKFSTADLSERGHWDAYQNAYEKMIRATAAEHAPWYVVPADNKWYSRLVVAAAIVDALASLNLEFPKIDAAQKKRLQEAREILTQE